MKEDVHKAICVNCKGANSAAFRGCSKYQEVIKAMMVSVTQKVSYRDALIKVKSDGELQHSRRHHRSSTVGNADADTCCSAAETTTTEIRSSGTGET